MEGKQLGIIGGMGSGATALFFKKIVEATEAETDQDHINTLILNHATLPDRTRVIERGEGQVFLEAIRKDLKCLERAGVNHIAIPCNTSHYFYDTFSQYTTVPIIHMIRETGTYIKEVYGAKSKVGILATSGAVETNVYGQACQELGLAYEYPRAAVQKQVMDIIYDQVKAGKPVDMPLFESIVLGLIHESHCDCVVLGCTELSCITLTETVSPYCVDAMELLVKKSIELAGKIYTGNKVKTQTKKDGIK